MRNVPTERQPAGGQQNARRHQPGEPRLQRRPRRFVHGISRSQNPAETSPIIIVLSLPNAAITEGRRRPAISSDGRVEYNRNEVKLSWWGFLSEAQNMVYRGHVENGLIRLEESLVLPEGADVEVRFLAESPSPESEAEIPSLSERLRDFIGKAEGLPPDASINLDHYLYGLPKRQ
jgi:hypothetical protein